MRKSILVMLLILAIGPTSCDRENVKAISTAELRDKIAGGWAGKVIGVTYGAPTEFLACGKTYDATIAWDPAMVRGALGQDDLYVQMSFLETLDQYGLDAPAAEFHKTFARADYPLCHANQKAWKNYWEGIEPPRSGSPEYSMHADDIDFQIEADFIGFMHPGMPQSSNRMCDTIGHIMCYGDGVYGGMFVSALYAEAFFESDIETLLLRALQSIPPESQYAQCIQDVIAGHRQYPDDWKKTWQIVQDRWGDVDLCVPEDAAGFNIDAKINGAYIAMGLLYGKGDFARTMEISLRCGQDSDCNPSSAAGVIGIVGGYSSIPEAWKSKIPEMADEPFIHTRYTFNSAIDRTLDYAKQIIVRGGGKIVDDTCYVVTQPPVSPPLEQSFSDLKYKYRSVVDANRGWSWKGDWNRETDAFGDPRIFTEERGAECTFAFNGAGALIIGKMGQECGKADIYLDGEFQRTVDCFYLFSYDGNWVNAFHLYHAIGLTPGEHEIKIVPTGTKCDRASGTRVYIEKAIVYAAREGAASIREPQ